MTNASLVHVAQQCTRAASDEDLCYLQLQGAFEPIKVDESSLTGESLPVTKSHSSKVALAVIYAFPELYTLMLSSLNPVPGVCLGSSKHQGGGCLAFCITCPASVHSCKCCNARCLHCSGLHAPHIQAFKRYEYDIQGAKPRVKEHEHAILGGSMGPKVA